MTQSKAPSNELANAIRVLSMDAVEAAQSGHPGMPMGMADIAEVLWRDFLNHNPTDPDWLGRDRFVISNGHGSMLLYSLLHLTGYDLAIDDLKQFRQLHSKTPGHPEYGYTPGVETTTGPLGQGLANAVGMAIAEQTLRATFSKDGYSPVEHHTYVFLGDGCLMEGISHEVSSLAGTFGLGKLIAFWDDNSISIDGKVRGWCRDDVPARFRAYGWHVVSDVDGHDRAQITAAIKAAKADDRPSFIACKTIIGCGSPNKAGSEKTHGAPLGAAEIIATREALGWPHPEFVIPDHVYAAWDAKEKGASLQLRWEEDFAAYQTKHPDLASEFLRRMEAGLPKAWAVSQDELLARCQQQQNKLATRKASQNCLQELGSLLPELLGGSADLTGSNLTKHQHSTPITPEHADGNYLYYGVREFGMSAIMNGIALHGGFIPYGGTFLVFADYARNALRMSALMRQRVIYVLSHDSIGLGEDGPTHQPIEHLAMLRATPNLQVWRPCDEVETAAAWRYAIEHHTGPTVLALSRQGVSAQARANEQLAMVKRGGYVLADCHPSTPELILLATGTEVELAHQAMQELSALDVAVRLVSMPCVEVFREQDASYRESVLPPTVTARVAVEAASPLSWHEFVGFAGSIVGIDRFGESAPGKAVYNELGITVAAIVAAAENVLNKSRSES